MGRRRRTAGERARLAIVGFAMLAVGSPAPAAPGDPEHGRTSWTMRGEPGSWVAGGRSYTWTPTNADFTFWRGPGRERIYAGVTAPDSAFSATFEPPPRGEIAIGTYPVDTRTHSDTAKMSVAGGDYDAGGRACSTVTGSFTVHHISFSADGTFDSLRLTFEQHCEGEAAALRGEITYRYADPGGSQR